MIDIHKSIADGIRDGHFYVDDTNKKIVPKFAGKKVVIIDNVKKQLDTVPDDEGNSKAANLAFDIYKKIIVPHNNKISNLQKDVKEATRRQTNEIGNMNPNITPYKLPDQLALTTLKEFKRIADILPEKHHPAYVDNIEYADNLVRYVTNKSSKKHELQIFINELVKAKKDVVISELPPHLQTIALEEFMKLSQQQIPKAFEHNLKLALSKAQGASKAYFKDEIQPLLQQLAINSTYNPVKLFHYRINKGLLCHLIENSTLKHENNKTYFVNNKNQPVSWDNVSGTFKETNIDEATKNFEKHEAEYRPYLKAKENIVTVSASASQESSNTTDQVTDPSFETLEQEKAYWLNKKEKALDDLTAVISDKLTLNNPSITDLNDPNRPMKISEQLNELYGGIWSECYIELTDHNYSEEQIVAQLLNIFIESYDLCEKNSKSSLLNVARQMFQKENLSQKEIDGYLKDWNRWLNFIEPQNTAKKTIAELSRQIKEKLGAKDGTNLAMFIDQCIDSCYHMTRQFPPMVYEIQKNGDQVDNQVYKWYTKTGDIVDFTTWPSFYLHKNGPLLSYGYVQPR